VNSRTLGSLSTLEKTEDERSIDDCWYEGGGEGACLETGRMGNEDLNASVSARRMPW